MIQMIKQIIHSNTKLGQNINPKFIVCDLNSSLDWRLNIKCKRDV